MVAYGVLLLTNLTLEKPDGAIKNGQSRYKAALMSKRHRIEGKNPRKLKR
jgi:hypothetical protein